MPYTLRDLSTAIDDQNLTLFCDILRERDATGHPTVDINHFRGSLDDDYTVLMRLVTPISKPLWEEGIDALLAARNERGEPLCNLNAIINSRIAITSLLSSGFVSNEVKLRVLPKILSVTTSSGKPALDFSTATEGMISILFDAALGTNNPIIVKTLLPARQTNGEFILNINAIVEGKTLLDRALVDAILGKYKRSGDMIAMIKELGGLTSAEIAELKHKERADAIFAEIKALYEASSDKTICFKEALNKAIYYDKTGIVDAINVYKLIELCQEKEDYYHAAIACLDIPASDKDGHITFAEALLAEPAYNPKDKPEPEANRIRIKLALQHTMLAADHPAATPLRNRVFQVLCKPEGLSLPEIEIPAGSISYDMLILFADLLYQKNTEIARLTSASKQAHRIAASSTGLTFALKPETILGSVDYII